MIVELGQLNHLLTQNFSPDSHYKIYRGFLMLLSLFETGPRKRRWTNNKGPHSSVLTR